MTIPYLRTLFVAVLTLSLSGCARQSESADRVQPDPIAVRVSTPKHVRVPAEVSVTQGQDFQGGVVPTAEENSNGGQESKDESEHES